MQLNALIFTVCCIALLTDLHEAKRGGSGRKRGKMKNSGSSRFIFYTHPRRRDYYDNENGAQIIKASHFDFEFLLGHKITFLCSAKGEPRPRITWFKDGVELLSHPFMQITEYNRGRDQIKSKLEITPARQMDSGTYDCEANNKYAVDRRSFKADFSSINK